MMDVVIMGSGLMAMGFTAMAQGEEGGCMWECSCCWRKGTAGRVWVRVHDEDSIERRKHDKGIQPVEGGGHGMVDVLRVDLMGESSA